MPICGRGLKKLILIENNTILQIWAQLYNSELKLDRGSLGTMGKH